MEIPSPLPPGITRHEYQRARGFLARVYGGGRCRRRLFSYGQLGGELAAFVAAVRWQAEERVGLPSRKQTGGYGYVQRGMRSYRTVSGSVRYYDAFIAWFWNDEGKPASTSFGVRAQGLERARELAERWLEGMQATVHSAALPRAPAEASRALAEAV